MIKETACLLILLCCVLHAAEEQWVVSSQGMNVSFSSWRDDGAKASAGVLVLVPGYTGKGDQMLDARWKEFAMKNDLVLLAPSFHAEGMENNEGRGYYYPEQGSGGIPIASHPVGRPDEITYHLNDLLGTTLATVGPAGVKFAQLTSFGQPLKAPTSGSSFSTDAPSSPVSPLPSNNQLPPTKR